MKEVYRSFEGKLDAGNQSGTIIYDGGSYWQIRHLSVWSDTEEPMYRIAKTALAESDFSDPGKIGEIEIDISNGCYSNPDMQEYHQEQWYSSPEIRQIQEKNQDNNWKRYV